MENSGEFNIHKNEYIITKRNNNELNDLHEIDEMVNESVQTHIKDTNSEQQ